MGQEIAGFRTRLMAEEAKTNLVELCRLSWSRGSFPVLGERHREASGATSRLGVAGSRPHVAGKALVASSKVRAEQERVGCC